MREIRIYVEGGGDKESKADLRRGFSNFLGSLRDEARRSRIGWSVIACGSRSDAFTNFRIALRQHPEATNLLLVDSEGPVTLTPREHLIASDGGAAYLRSDPGAECHLMVQAMEAWIIADPDTLAAFYGHGFLASRLPSTRDVERIPKETLFSSLAASTRGTRKREYHKLRHGPLLVGQLSAATVRGRSRHCDRLFKALERHLSETSRRPS